MSEAAKTDLLDGLDLIHAIAVARSLARDVGAMQLERLGKADVELKGPIELVTEVDRESERRLVAGLLDAFPKHDIYGEEEARKDERESPFRWIIDPIDGTTNFAHGVPLFCISMGLEHRPEGGEGRIVAGLVHAPAQGETWHGTRGTGAFLNDRPIRVSEEGALGDALLATGFAYCRNETRNDNLDNWAELTRLSRGLRRLGSAALDLCYVAAGRFDGFWEMHLKPYDVAAGAFLIEAAGGRVTDTEGGQDWLFGGRVIATNGAVHDALSEALAPVVDDGTIPFRRG